MTKKAAAATPDATAADPIPTDAELEATVAAGDVTATVDGAEVAVVAIDLANSPAIEVDASTTDAAAEVEGAAAPVRVRELLGSSIALGAPGTITKQREDGTWYAAEPGDE